MSADKPEKIVSIALRIVDYKPVPLTFPCDGDGVYNKLSVALSVSLFAM